MVLGPWIVRAGLVNTSCLTFESANTPGQFLRHSNSADLAPKCAPTELDQDTGTLKDSVGRCDLVLSVRP